MEQPFWKPMEQSFLKNNSSSESQKKKILRILRNPTVHYRVHNSPPPVPILRLINLIHAHQNDLRSILILFSHLCLGLPSGLFPSSFPNKILCAPLLSPKRATGPISWPADSINPTFQLVSSIHKALSMQNVIKQQIFSLSF